MATLTKSSEQIIASNQWSRLISGRQFGETKPVQLTVTAQLIKRAANDYPYFTITGDVIKLDKRLKDPIIACGAIHDLILEYFPNLAPLVMVHLSGPDGVPMHAESNAIHWAGLSTYSDGRPMAKYDREMLARHLQASPEIADSVRDGLIKGLPWDYITNALKLIELWSDQAGAARKLLIDAN